MYGTVDFHREKYRHVYLLAVKDRQIDRIVRKLQLSSNIRYNDRQKRQ